MQFHQFQAIYFFSVFQNNITDVQAKSALARLTLPFEDTVVTCSGRYHLLTIAVILTLRTAVLLQRSNGPSLRSDWCTHCEPNVLPHTLVRFPLFSVCSVGRWLIANEHNRYPHIKNHNEVIDSLSPSYLPYYNSPRCGLTRLMRQVYRRGVVCCYHYYRKKVTSTGQTWLYIK